MSCRIGILCGHGEAVTPDNPRFSRFFALLAEHRCQVVPLPDNRTPDALADYPAVLIGGARDKLAPEEVLALREWTAAGGRLLVLSSRDPTAPRWRGSRRFLGRPRPDETAACENGHRSTRLVDGLTFHRSRGRDITIVDQPALTGWQGPLLYHSNCTLILDAAGERITHSLPLQPVRGQLQEFAFLRIRQGAGAVLVAGSSPVANNTNVDGSPRSNNHSFLCWLLRLWIPNLVDDEMRSRKQMPQRHRLLHGFPMKPLMWSLNRISHRMTTGGFLALQKPPSHGTQKRLGSNALLGDRFSPHPERPVLVGVLPHPFCNPAVKGCGFCTFPHEYYSAQKSGALVASVIREIDGFIQEADHRRSPRGPGWRQRRVKAVYFGGGTANLTPAEPFRALCRKLTEAFDLSGAEVTLEGVPADFVRRRPLLIDILPETRARHFRISMGLQTFDLDQLRRMGRLGFGTPETFAEVARQGHARGFTVSGDLLFNLPGQTLEQMRQDVRRAIDLGLDHICLYHLVLFDGLGTEWSRDPALLASLPMNETAADHWLALREELLGNSYYQTTLTNFEREAFRGDSRRFLYEASAFRPEEHDMIGFGPAAYSLIADWPPQPCRGPSPGRTPSDYSIPPYDAVKTVNPDSASDYVAAVDGGCRPYERVFLFGRDDLKLLYLTRKIATLGVERAAYRAYFGSDCVEDYPMEFCALAADHLVEVAPEAVRLTPRGMFYADTVAGLLASQQVQSFRDRQRLAELARQQGRPGRAHLFEFGAYAHLWSHMG